MTVEDRLRESLRRRADALPVGDDGWASIQARVDGRARGRRGLAIALAAVLPVGVAVAVLAFALVDPGDDEQSVRIPTATTEQPGPAPSTERSEDEPWQVARIAPEDDFAGIWPEVTAAELAETERSPEPWRGDPVEVGRRYVVEHFGIREPAMYPFEETGPGRGQIGFDVPPHERPYAGRVLLARARADCCAWFVREAHVGHVTVHPVGFSGVDGVLSTGALRDPLVLEVSSTVAGEATVKLLLPGGEEVVDSRTVSLDGRASRRIAFRAPLDVPGLAVRLRMTDADGRLHAHELRVNGLPAADPGLPRSVECGTTTTEGPDADEALQEVFGIVLVGTPAKREHVVTDRFRPVLDRRMKDLAASGYTVDRFTVTGDWYRDERRAAICATVFLERDGRLAAGRFDVFEVVRDGDRWQVDRWFPGPMLAVAQATTVRLFFWEHLDCTEADRMEEATVEVPGGADPQTVLHELFSGPDARADGVGPPNTTALPADARVRFAFVEDGVAVVDITDATDAGGGACIQSARQEQVERTLLAIPGVEAVQLQVEGREGEPPFQP